MKKYLLAALLAGLTQLAPAQAEDVANKRRSYAVENPRIGFGIQPVILFFGGFQVDVQPYLKPRHQLVVAPQVYYRKNASSWIYSNDDDNDVTLETFSGFGLDLTYRIFPKQGGSFYYGGGVGYNLFQPKYKTSAYVPITDNGLPAYTLKDDVLNQQTINRASVNMIMGWQEPTPYGILIDLYWGAGFRYGFVDKLYDDKVNFTKGMWNMAYSGTYFVLGLKLGFEM